MPISQDCPLTLGSGSPRRREILEGLGVPIRVMAAHPPEDLWPGEGPVEYLDRIVIAKLAAVCTRIDAAPHAGLLVADTIVVLDGEVIGKPDCEADAVQILQRLAGKTHQVFTRYAISLASQPSVAVRARTVTSRVTLRAAEPAEIVRYAATGEGLDKAGAYAAQGIGSFLVERIEGSYSNVVGLPACEVVLDLSAVGLLVDYP